MVNQFKSATIPVAERPKRNRPLHSITLTTQSFFQLTPVLYKDMYIDDDFEVSGDMFSRVLPMQTPAFVTADNYVRAFFVPYRTVQPSFIDVMENNFHVNASGAGNLVERNRWCTSNDFVSAFFFPASGFVQSATASGYDIATQGSNGTAYWKLTVLGAQVFKVLQGLGYQFFTDTTVSSPTPINLLPLMCYLRVFMDWYWPKNYVTDANALVVSSYFKRDNGSEQFSPVEVRNMMQMIGYTFYDNEVFDECWDQPMAPNNSNSYSTMTISPSDGIGAPVTNVSANGTPVIDLTPTKPSKLTLNLLSSLSDFLKRNQISSARTIDRFLARHGKQLSPVIANRSVYLGEHSFRIGVSDVAATIQDQQNNLGDLAGKGVSKGSCKFECHSGTDRGFFLVLLSTIPDANLVQGIDRNCLKTVFTDHYIPEFALKGVDAVSAAEVYTSLTTPGMNRLATGDTTAELPFGYLPAWYSYNHLRSHLLGDYNVASRGAIVLQREHTFRLFDDTYWGNASNIVHSLAFQQSSDRDQYHRLGYLSANQQDWCRVFFEWNAKFNSSIPMAKDTYNFDDIEGHIQKDVTIDHSSVSFN